MNKVNEQKRWKDIDSVLLNNGAYTPEDFEPSEELKDSFFEFAKVLVVGAGGLGCEILKDLALMGFKDIHVIDLDTIDVTNLNRQFLFRKDDVNKYKSDVAAKFVEKRVPGCKVTAHVGKIQEKSKDFYEQFQVIIAGLDNIEARRWLNQLVHSMVEWKGEEVDPTTVRPLIDGGTEGLKGQSRVIMPFKTACFECTLNTIPRAVNTNAYQFCTIAKTPRIPEHCIAYAQIILWEESFPDRAIDKDSVEDMTWLYEKAADYANKNGIKGVTFKLTQGVVKNIIPAIASTNALISAACCNEAFKIMTGCSKTVDNYMMFMGSEGIYTNVIKYDSNENCSICVGMKPRKIEQQGSKTLGEFIEYLKNEYESKFASPTITNDSGTLYLNNPAFASMYSDNLAKKLSEFKEEDSEVIEFKVQDTGADYPIRFVITLI